MKAKLLRLHISEHDRFQGKPLYEAMVEKCQAARIAGVTVLRGLEGYGETSAIHRPGVLSHDLPIVVVIVDSPENVARVLPDLEAMMDKGLIAVSDVDAIRVQKSSSNFGD